jgi:translation initiation factor 2B subunit (eIF-2B alpha/beta/delta family)
MEEFGGLLYQTLQALSEKLRSPVALIRELYKLSKGYLLHDAPILLTESVRELSESQRLIEVKTGNHGSM